LTATEVLDKFRHWMRNSSHSRNRGASQLTSRIGPSNDRSDAEQVTDRHAAILAELDMMSAAFGADHEEQTESSHARSSQQLLYDAAAAPGPFLVKGRSASSDSSDSSVCLQPPAVLGDRCSASPRRPVGRMVSSTLPDKDATVSKQVVGFPLVATPANASTRLPRRMVSAPSPRKQVSLRT
jgi:hypothetical protein